MRNVASFMKFESLNVMTMSEY